MTKHWNRGCNNLLAAGNVKQTEADIESMLRREFPVDQYPFDIQVHRDKVDVSDYAEIRESEQVATDIHIGHVDATRKALALTIGRLKKAGKLK